MTVVPVTLPSLGEAVTEGTITRWHAAIGDEVTAGTPLYGVSTNKVDTEVPAPVTGTLVEITVAEDQKPYVEVEVLDRGKGFDQASIEQPTPEKTFSGRQKRGWGLQIMRSLMDSVAITSGEGGTRILMRKYK